MTTLLHEVVHSAIFKKTKPVPERILGLLYAITSEISASQFTRWHLDHHAPTSNRRGAVEARSALVGSDCAATDAGDSKMAMTATAGRLATMAVLHSVMCNPPRNRLTAGRDAGVCAESRRRVRHADA
jgi:hypothetical protein